MNLLSLVISVSSRRVIKSKYITDPVLLPGFSLGDTVSGTIAVVSETNDPTRPTLGVAITGSSNIALTDGVSVVYAQAASVTVQNGNELVFTLDVDGSALRAAMANGFVPAFFEVRATAATGQDEIIAREPVVITNAVTASPLTAISVTATESLGTTGHA